MSLPSSSPWQVQPAAWQFVLQQLSQACEANSFLQRLRSDLLLQTGTRLVDWLDHLGLSRSDTPTSQLAAMGFQSCEVGSTWFHAGGLFPELVMIESDASFPRVGVGLRVESVDRFLQAHPQQVVKELGGEPGDPLRWAVVDEQNGVSVSVVERHGARGFERRPATREQREEVLEVERRFASRPRPWPLEERSSGFRVAREQFERAAQTLGRDWACDRFFASERAYWQSRNQAARVQYARQNRLGLGWANHDHHTYRSSREHFADLITTLETMGFECRERFYAGAQAGWGAQVLEQPACRLVVFADVDLSPDEVTGDFAHQGLEPSQEFGTVGLWCQLHGEAFLSAGMHHLECQFDFDAARVQLTREGIESMTPFTDFDFLRQSFTEGEMWSVPAERLDELVRRRVVTREQADEFTRHGARGSHLEVLERNDGYKGFNQTGISDIIQRTHPTRK